MTITKMLATKAPERSTYPVEKSKKQKNDSSLFSKPFTLAKSIFLGTAAIITVLLFSSCARKAVFQISPVVPAARGYIKTKKDSNKNYNVYVSLENLAEPNRLTPAKQTYVVWIVSNDNSTKNVGQVKTSSSLFSHTLKGSFETVSVSKPIKIFITAENNATTEYPGDMVVMTTNEF